MAKRAQKKLNRRPYFCTNERYEVMVKVDDDWYPNYPNDEIRIAVIKLPQFTRDDPMVVRICAWGNDDYGLEKDFTVSSNGDRTRKYKDLIKYADQLKELEPINAKFLKSEGWISA